MRQLDDDRWVIEQGDIDESTVLLDSDLTFETCKTNVRPLGVRATQDVKQGEGIDCFARGITTTQVEFKRLMSWANRSIVIKAANSHFRRKHETLSEIQAVKDGTGTLDVDLGVVIKRAEEASFNKLLSSLSIKAEKGEFTDADRILAKELLAKMDELS